MIRCVLGFVACVLITGICDAADSYVITFIDGPHKGQELSAWRRAK